MAVREELFNLKLNIVTDTVTDALKSVRDLKTSLTSLKESVTITVGFNEKDILSKLTDIKASISKKLGQEEVEVPLTSGFSDEVIKQVSDSAAVLASALSDSNEQAEKFAASMERISKAGSLENLSSKDAEDIVQTFIVRYPEAQASLENFIFAFTKFTQEIRASNSSLKLLVTDVIDVFKKGLGEDAPKIVLDATTTIANHFKDLYDKVVGRSYIPDLVNEVEDWLRKLTPSGKKQIESLIGQFSKLKKAALDYAALQSKPGAVPDLVVELDLVQQLKQFNDLASAFANFEAQTKSANAAAKARRKILKESAEAQARLRVETEAFNAEQKKFVDANRDVARATDEFKNLEERLAKAQDELSNLGKNAATRKLQKEFNDLSKTIDKAINQGAIKDFQELSDKLASLQVGITAERDTSIKAAIADINKLIASHDLLEDTDKRVLKRLFDSYNQLATGADKLEVLRHAFVGFGESTSIGSKGLDILIALLSDTGKNYGNLIDVVKTLNKPLERTKNTIVSTSQSLAQLSNRMDAQVDIIKDIAAREGVSAKAFSNTSLQITKVTKAYKDLETALDSSEGQIKAQKQLRRVSTEVELLDRNLKFLESREGFSPELITHIKELGIEVTPLKKGLDFVRSGVTGINEATKEKSLETLKDRFEAVGTVSDIQGRTLSTRIQDIRDGLTLLGADVPKVKALEVALLGLGTQRKGIDVLLGTLVKGVKVIDRFTGGQKELRKEQSKFDEFIQRTATRFTNFSNTLVGQVQDLKKYAAETGVAASEFSGLDKSLQNVANAAAAVEKQIIKHGKPTADQVENLRLQYRLLNNQVEVLEKRNVLNPQARAVVDQLIASTQTFDNQLDIMDIGLTKANEELEAAKKKQAALSKETKAAAKAAKEFSSSNNTVRTSSNSVSQSIQAQVREMSILVTATTKMNDTLKTFAASFGGSLAGGIIGSLGIVSDTVDNLFGNIGASFDIVTTKSSASLGLMADEADNFNAIVQDIYANNFGDSVDQIAENTEFVIQRFKRLNVESADEFSEITQNAFRISDAFGFDINDSVDAASALVRDFGITSTQAFDFITGLAQKGVVGPDVLDSITEYGIQIAEAGGDAEDFFNVLETGFRGGGVFGTDRPADLFKEFRLQILEGSDDVREALKKLGFNSGEFIGSLASGQTTVIDAYEAVRTKLLEVSDQTERFAIGQAIMATQFEDIGDLASLSITTVNTDINTLAGATLALDAQYDNFGTKVGGIFRNLQIALIPFTELVLDIGNRILPYIDVAVQNIIPTIQTFIAWLASIKDAITVGDYQEVQNIITSAFANIIDWVSDNISIWIENAKIYGANFAVSLAEGLWEAGQKYIAEVLEAIGKLIDSYMPHSDAKKGPLSNISVWGKSFVTTLGDSIMKEDLSAYVESALGPVEDIIAEKLGGEGFETFQDIKSDFSSLLEQIQDTGDFDQSTFTDLLSKVPEENRKDLEKSLGLQLEYKKALEEQKRIAEDPTSTDQEKDAARERIKLVEDQLSFIAKAEKKSDRDLAKDKLAVAKNLASKAAGAVQGRMEAEAEFLTKGYEEQKRILEENYRDGLVSEDEYLKDLLKLEEKYVDAARKTGLTGALEEHVQLVKDTKTRLEEVLDAKKLSKKLPEGATLLESLVLGDKDIDPLKDFSLKPLEKDIKDKGKRLGGEFADGFEDGTVNSIQDSLSNIGTTIKTFATEVVNKLKKYLTENISVGELAFLAPVLGGITTFLASPIFGKLLTIVSSVGKLTGGFRFLVGVLSKFTIIGSVVYLVFLNWDTIVATLGPIFKSLGQTIGTFVQEVSGFISTFYNEFLDRFGGIEVLSREVGLAINELKTNFTEFFGEAQTAFGQLLAGDFSGAKDTILKGLESLFDLEQTTALMEKLASALGGAFVSTLTTYFGEDATRDILNQFNKFSEGLQKAIDAILKSNTFQAFATISKLVAENIKEIGIAFAIVGELVALNLLVANIGAITTGFLALSAAALPVVLIVGAIIAVFSQLDHIVVLLDTTFASLIDGIGGIIEFGSGVIQVIEGLVIVFSDSEAGLQKIGEGLTNIMSGLITTIGNLALTVGGIVSVIVSTVVGAIGDLIAKILEWAGVSEESIQFWRELGPGVTALLQESLTKIGVTLDQLNLIVTTKMAGLRTIWQQTIFLLQYYWDRFVDWISNIGTRVWDSIVGFFQSIGDYLVFGSLIPDIINKIFEWFDKLDNLDDFIFNVLNAFGNFGDEILAKLSNLVLTMGGFWDDLGVRFGNSLTKIFNLVDDVLTKNTKLFGILRRFGPILTTITTLFLNWESLKPLIDHIITGFQKMSVSFFDVAAALGSIFTGNTFQNILKEIETGFTGLVEGLIQLILGAAGLLISNIAISVRDIAQPIGDLLNAIGLEEIAQKFINVSILMQLVVDTVQLRVDQAVEIMGNLVEQVNTIFALLVDDPLRSLNYLLTEIVSIFTNIKNSIIFIFTAIYNELVGNSIIPDMIADILSAMLQFGLDFASSLTDLLPDFNTIKNSFTAFGGKIVDALKEGISNAWSKITSFVKDSLGSLFGGEGIFSTLKNAISGGDDEGGQVSEIKIDDESVEAFALFKGTVGGLQTLLTSINAQLILLFENFKLKLSEVRLGELFLFNQEIVNTQTGFINLETQVTQWVTSTTWGLATVKLKMEEVIFTLLKMRKDINDLEQDGSKMFKLMANGWRKFKSDIDKISDVLKDKMIPFFREAIKLARELATARHSGTGAANAAVEGFAEGAWEIPQDMTANIHKGEMILPATIAEDFRNVLLSIRSIGIGAQNLAGLNFNNRAVAAQGVSGSPNMTFIINAPNLQSNLDIPYLATEIGREYKRRSRV